MPTFNQLVRKGREVAVTKSTAPAMQYISEALLGAVELLTPAFSPEERCVHRGSYRHPQEAQLRAS